MLRLDEQSANEVTGSSQLETKRLEGSGRY